MAWNSVQQNSTRSDCGCNAVTPVHTTAPVNSVGVAALADRFCFPAAANRSPRIASNAHRRAGLTIHTLANCILCPVW
jgi:hypothetical protein